MKMTKRIFVFFLAAIMLLTCFACKPKRNETTATAEPTRAPAATQKPSQATDAPNSEPAAPMSEADRAFWALDDEIFVWYVSSDITTLDQFCRHPENFGIDETTVPVTLGDFTEEANNEWVANCENWRDRLLTIDREALSDHLQFSYDNYLRFFEAEIESKDWFYNYEPLDLYVGLQSNLPLEFGLYNFYDEQDVKNYMTLLSDVPRYMGQVLAFEQERAARGWFMTEDALDTVLADIDAVAKSAETSFLHGTFEEAMEKIDFLTDEQKQAYIKQNDELVGTAWVQGYQLLYDGMETLRPKCRAKVGAFEQGGAAYDYYCWKLKQDGNSNRTVQDACDFLESRLNALFNGLLEHYSGAYSQIQENRKITLGSITDDEAYLRSLMPQIVPEMPDVEVRYVEVPEELQDSFSPAAYLTPAVDDFTHNIILTNPKDQEDYSMSTLAHEGFPGHMFQFVYQYSLGTIPKFQMVIETNGYAESWSTNSELNVASINDRFGADYAMVTFFDEYFTNTLVTYCSILINGQGKSVEDIRSYLSSWGMEQYADYIYDISITMPVYYFKYVLGFNELRDLTETCQRTLGKKFDSVTFYEEYLSWGPGTFDLLRERMNNWANAQ